MTKAAVKKAKRAFNSMEDFIRAYQGANSNAEVAKILNITEASVAVRASGLRNSDPPIPLKSFTRKERTSSVNRAAMAALAKSLLDSAEGETEKTPEK